MKLLYISGARLPSELAHGLQIMENSEAFARAGANVHLWYARRGVGDDLFASYGVPRAFTTRKLPSVDVHRWLDGRAPGPVVALAFYVMLITFGIAAGIGAWFVRPDVVYCRDPLPLLVAGWLNPRRRFVWEAHSLKTSGRGSRLQRWALRRAALTVAITPPLRDALLKLRPDATVIVAHDGIRAERFQSMPTQAEARMMAGWPADAFVVGYVGRLTTYNMAKGIDTLIDAIARLPENHKVALALVGGPDDIAARYRARWESLGLPAANYLYAGQVAAADVPRFLAAFDVCAMPHPRQDHFAYFSSPLKLFEYMASGRPLVASDLPSWADVVTDGREALLVPPSDADALAAALDRLRHDPALRSLLGEAAKARAFAGYTWDARARSILAALGMPVR